MKRIKCWILAAFCSVISHASLAQGNLTPNGDPWNYDDGYVLTDISGNAGGLTTYWGYQNASQYQADANTIVFHLITLLNAYTEQVVADTYQLPSGVIPPAAPFEGNFNGPGPDLEATPISETIQDIPVPEPSALALLAFGTFILLKVSSRAVKIQPPPN